MHTEVTQESASLAPLYPDRIDSAATGVMGRPKMGRVIDRDPNLVQPKAEVEIFDVQKIGLVHAAHHTKSRGWQHHARAANRRNANALTRWQTLMEG